MENFENEGAGLSDEQLEQYLALVKRMFERMERENSWPWKTSLIRHGNSDPQAFAKHTVSDNVARYYGNTF